MQPIFNITALPTVEPSTGFPTVNPTGMPSEIPSEIPTEIPSEIPTEIPTEIPSELPTELPTDAPTKGCKNCYKYWVKLRNIEEEDDKMDTDDCDNEDMEYASVRDAASKIRHTDGGDTFVKRGKGKGKRKRGWHRRKMLWDKDDINER